MLSVIKTAAAWENKLAEFLEIKANYDKHQQDDLKTE